MTTCTDNGQHHAACVGNLNDLPFDWLPEPYATEVQTTGKAMVPANILYRHLDKRLYEDDPEKLIPIECEPVSKERLHREKMIEAEKKILQNMFLIW